MKYIYHQLLKLVSEEYTPDEVLEKLVEDNGKDLLIDSINDNELKPQDLFSKEELEQWAYGNDMSYRASAE